MCNLKTTHTLSRTSTTAKQIDIEIFCSVLDTQGTHTHTHEQRDYVCVCGWQYGFHPHVTATFARGMYTDASTMQLQILIQCDDLSEIINFFRRIPFVFAENWIHLCIKFAGKKQIGFLPFSTERIPIVGGQIKSHEPVEIGCHGFSTQHVNKRICHSKLDDSNLYKLAFLDAIFTTTRYCCTPQNRFVRTRACMCLCVSNETIQDFYTI